MFASLMAFFSGSKFIKLSSAMSLMAPLLQHLEENYLNDKNAKNALIDTMIDILQSHKEK